ncbi:MAG: pyruvate formate lyase family protein [Coriobacteriales bacterium]|jgi:pyruvate formate-lyase/glycerol dehydratase family glycyl radical enzyme
MYQFSPVTDRVAKMRDHYRNSIPNIDLDRYKIVTDFYKNNQNLTGILKRAYNFKNMCEKMPLRVEDDELIVGSYVGEYHACALYPENSVDWLKEVIETRNYYSRPQDKYTMREEDRQYFLDTVEFWEHECLVAKVEPYLPEKYKNDLALNECCMSWGTRIGGPIGHFCANYDRAVKDGFKKTRDLAAQRMEELEEKGLEGDEATAYNFYRAVTIVCDGIILFAKRYSAYCAELAEKCEDPKRKAELEQISKNLDNCVENPCRNYWEALQTVWFYQMCIMMDANLHGTSVGRLDQYVGWYLEDDLKNGDITREQAQELMDMYVLKVGELNKIGHEHMSMAVPGYTSGQLITVGGTDGQGNDATNAATYMLLETGARLLLHDPPMALRTHPNMPYSLWECAIETTKRAGGVPSFYSDPVVVEMLQQKPGHGLSLEDANNYTVIGCVEPSGWCNEWSASGVTGGNEAYFNLVNGLLMAINNGTNPMPQRDGSPRPKTGPATGYLYEMESMEDVKKALTTQIEYWMKWDETIINLFEDVARRELPQPLVSALMIGCMESGRDVMDGGAKYNGNGITGVGMGNVIDSLNIIDYMCFKTKKCTTRELYDAIMANWEGYDELRAYINTEVPRYGNGDKEADKYAGWFAHMICSIGNNLSGYRGYYGMGTWPVTMNVIYGYTTWATPDGRIAGTPLADGISAVQQMDTNGPTAELASVAEMDHTEFHNGTLLNMKFHPSAVNSDAGVKKLIELIQAYFYDMKGMQMQLNIVSADTMRAAQKDPDSYKDLVVRIAGFSAYFVEVYEDAQNDLIRRTEQSL